MPFNYSWRLWRTALVAMLIVPCASAAPPSGPAADYLTAIERFEPWAESVWSDAAKLPGAGYFGDGASDGNGGIRGSGNIALAYAVLVREQPQSSQRARRLKRVEATLRYCAQTHSSGPTDIFAIDGKKWGVFPGLKKFDAHGWQSPLWAANLGLAALLVEKDLDPAVVAACQRVVAAEADVLATIPPATGHKRDTKCEENAWNSSVPALAAAWMPNDPRAKAWIETAKKYLVNTYTVPDLTGDPLKDWITTQTLFPSFGLENHGFYHPMYHIDGGNSMGDTLLMTRLANPKLAEELRPFAEHNVRPVWNFLRPLFLESGETAYPSGVDWSLHSFEHTNYLAYIATQFRDPEAYWLQRRLAKAVLARQAVNGDGRFVGDSCPKGFYREAVNVRHHAIAYLHNQAAGFPADAGRPAKPALAHHADVGLIVHRTADRLVTVSYGLRTMMLVYPLNGTTAAQQFLISPNTTSLLGNDGTTKLLNFQEITDGFRAELQLSGKKGRRSKVAIESRSAAVVMMEIPNGDSRLPRDEWPLLAIENHAFSGGERTVRGGTEPYIVKERSGKSVTASDGWLTVDDWIGFASPDGVFEYRVPKSFNRNGAAEDSLVLKLKDSSRPRAVVIVTGTDAPRTVAVRKDMKWTIDSDACSLSFVDPSGATVTTSIRK